MCHITYSTKKIQTVKLKIGKTPVKNWWSGEVPDIWEGLMFSPPLGKGGHGEHWVSRLAAHPPDIHLQAVKDKEEIAPLSGPSSATRVPTLSMSSANHGRWQPKEQLKLNTRGILINLWRESIRNLVRSGKPGASFSLGVQANTMQWPVELWLTKGPEGYQRHWGVFGAPCASREEITSCPYLSSNRKKGAIPVCSDARWSSVSRPLCCWGFPGAGTRAGWSPKGHFWWHLCPPAVRKQVKALNSISANYLSYSRI